MEKHSKNISKNIALAMLMGLLLGLLIKSVPVMTDVYNSGLSSVLNIVGSIFITLLKMIVVPVVFVSLVNGITNLHGNMQLGRICLLSVGIYLFITVVAISMAIITATFFNIGIDANLGSAITVDVPQSPDFTKILLEIFPKNILAALAKGDMLQVLFVAVFVGYAILSSGNAGVKAIKFFQELNPIVVSMVWIVMRFAPFGIFALLVPMVSNLGLDVITEIMCYIITVACVLIMQLIFTYNLMLRLFSNINLKEFLINMRSAMLFAFSVSSSSAAIPLVMEAAKDKLKLSQQVVSFVVPLGTAVNMDGTAIMQGVATVFISNAYGVDLALSSYIIIIVMATMSSIGTAGMPGIGMITLSMVLSQVGLPIEGISIIIGVDILVDMMRTAINICGGCVTACIVDKYCRDS